MARVTLTYNSSTGSDTAASGSGPGTAVTGSSATNGTGNVVNLDGSPDLSGVAVNDAIWVNSASGSRHISRITAVDDGADTVTTEDLLSLSGGKSWAIGGSRKTFTADTSRQDVKDAAAGWRFEAEGTLTYTWAGAGVLLPNVCDTTNGGIEIVAAAGASPTFDWTGDGPLLASFGGCLSLRGIAFSNTTSTNSAARILRALSGVTHLEMVDCSAVCAGSCLYGATGQIVGRVVSCDLESTYQNGIELGREGALLVEDCEIHECGAVGASAGVGQGILVASTNAYSSITVRGCRIWGQHDNGIQIDSDSVDAAAVVSNNVIDDNGGHGLYFANTLAISNRSSVFNNAITENGGFGIKVNSSSGADTTIWSDFNAFRGNASGEVSNLTKGAGSVTLTSDPYADAAARDYRINSTAGGGQALYQAGLGYVP